ncbi:unnamed protein product [Rotaria magnacalcarata]|uniref:Uncharacterized protein n=6 Tax=Rotaria magnacalcarata TaxID=392030 RepID=A0A814Y432_9BILA|nr:unnamed protein product [Rotaria magnacalcarata]CAF1616143.1 unnamed protein product [Rotaria magnacalcarata]
MQSSRDSSPRPLLSPNNPQQERTEMIHHVNKIQMNHDQDTTENYQQQQDKDEQVNPRVNYPPHSSSNSRPRPSNYNVNDNGANKLRPLMEYNDTSDSPSEVKAQTSTTNRLNKKRKQCVTDEPMEHYYDESPSYPQSQDDNGNHLPTHTTTSNATSKSKPITEEAKRFAQTRYAFPPFNLSFKSTKINDKRVIDELIKFSKVRYSFDLDLAGYRMAPNRYNANESNLLIFVKNSRSFSFLLIDIEWPDKFGSEKFTMERQPAIAPQLAIIIENVSYKTNVLEMENDIKSRYDNVVKVIRLKNKNQFDTKFVKVEFNSPKTRDDILNKGYMTIDYIKYDVKEYLPQASILICSNCMGIGHFRKQCKQTNATCKICSEQVKDASTHQCQGVVKCLHCGGAHHSNDLKCMVIKQFRSDLTKNLLSAPHKQSFNRQTDLALQFPPLPQASKQSITNYQMSTNVQNGIMIKLDQILNSIHKFESTMGDLTKRTEVIEEWITKKGKNVTKMENDIKAVQLSNVRIDGELKHQVKVIEKLFIPVLDDIITVLSELNIKDGRVLDADFRSRSGLWKSEFKALLDKRLIL